MKLKLLTIFPNEQVGGNKVGAKLPWLIDLYDENLNPIWFEHPELGSKSDVIAIRAQKPELILQYWHQAANRVGKDNIPIEPGTLIFVIGYPSSLSTGPGLPLWKSGYLASEPMFDIRIQANLSEIGGMKGGSSLPGFFIDTLTRQGMSGSPVFARFCGTWDEQNPYDRNINSLLKNPSKHDHVYFAQEGIKFIGCYSGRIPDTEQGAELGICWNTDVIDDICANEIRGRNPHDIE